MMIAISRYELRSRAVSQKGGGVRMGGMGLVTYRALGGEIVNSQFSINN